MDKKMLSKLIVRGRELQILQIYLSDYREKYHVRLISRLFGLHHRTVSLTLERLEKKDILNHITVGNRRNYYLNFDNPFTKSYLINAEFARQIGFIDKYFIMKKMIMEIGLNVLKNTPLIIFGSYAKGKEMKESDIDLLIIKTGKEKLLKKKLIEFFERHNKKVHVQTINQTKFEDGLKKKDHLIIEVTKDHVILNNIPVVVDILWRHYYEIR